jgi:hypothetical protein
MGKIIDKLLENEHKERRLEYVAVARLKDPDEIKQFYDEYREWLPKYLPEEIQKGRTLDDIVSTNLGYVIGYLSDPELRKIWYDIIGPKHPVFGTC